MSSPSCLENSGSTPADPLPLHPPLFFDSWAIRPTRPPPERMRPGFIPLQASRSREKEVFRPLFIPPSETESPAHPLSLPSQRPQRLPDSTFFGSTGPNLELLLRGDGDCLASVRKKVEERTEGYSMTQERAPCGSAPSGREEKRPEYGR